MIIFAEITQLLRYRFIQGVNPLLKMHKALKIQQTTLVTILCMMSICYGTKQTCKEDSLLSDFSCLFTTEFQVVLDAVPTHLTNCQKLFIVSLCLMMFKDDSNNSKIQSGNIYMDQSKQHTQLVKRYESILLKFFSILLGVRRLHDRQLLPCQFSVLSLSTLQLSF